MESTRQETVAKLTRGFPADHPLVQQARALLADPHAPVAEERPVLDALLTRRPFRARERDLAAWLILRLPWTDEQRTSITKSLSRDVERVVKRGGPGQIIAWGMTAGALLGISKVAPGFLAKPEPWRLLALSSFVFWGLVLAMPVALLVDAHRFRRMRPVLEALAEIGDPEGIVALAKATEISTYSKPAATALKRMTERIRPEDKASLSDTAMAALCRVLRSLMPPVTTVCTLLEALEILGDERAIPTVTRLARSAGVSDIREAAAAALPMLEQRALQRKDAAELVRASAETGDAGATLLRATQGASVTEPSQLLRAMSSREPEERGM